MTRHIDATVPYAWPYDGRLLGEHLALLLAGWDHGWSARSFGAPAAQDAITELAAATRATGSLVIGVAHEGAEPAADPAADLVVTALGIDGFHDGPLDGVLRRRGITHLLVAGHGIEGPVHSTLRSANDRGYECLLVADACSSLAPDLAAAAAHQVTMSGGIFGAVGATAPTVAALTTPLDPDPASA